MHVWPWSLLALVIIIIIIISNYSYNCIYCSRLCDSFLSCNERATKAVCCCHSKRLRLTNACALMACQWLTVSGSQARFVVALPVRAACNAIAVRCMTQVRHLAVLHSVIMTLKLTFGFSFSRTALHDTGAPPRHRFVWSLGMVAVSFQVAALRHPPLHRRTFDTTSYLHMLCQQRALKHRTVPHKLPAESTARVRR